MDRLKSITVLGSSAASDFKSATQDKSWPLILKSKLPLEIDFQVKIIGGMTLVRSIPALLDKEKTDLLILHFGTAIGWPSSIMKYANFLGVHGASEFSFHQPAFRSKSFRRRTISALKQYVRNLIKYALYFTGQYKTRTNSRELEDQIAAVSHLAKQKGAKVIWIQHQALHHRKIYLERRCYLRFYAEIITHLRKHQSSDFTLVEIPENFLVSQNYLIDAVHLSARGHRQLSNIILESVFNFFPK